MMDVFTKVVLAGAVLFSLAWLAVSQRRFFKGVSDSYLRLSHLQRVLVLIAVAICSVHAQKQGVSQVGGVEGTNDVTQVSGTNDVGGVDSGEAESFPLQGEELRGTFQSGRPSQFLTSGRDSPRIAPPSELASLGGYASPFSVTDIACGYRLESVATNNDISYAMPSNGTVHGTWHLTGAYDDVQKVSLSPHPSSPIPHPFLFPLGTNLCDSLWAYTWGKVRPRLKNITDEIVAVGSPMSAIPVVSRFWTAATTNDTYLLTWENFALGRIPASANVSSLIPHPSSLVSAQLELCRNGDFITRSNEVESVYRRVIEPNPIGPGNPEDPDNHGMPLHPYGPVQDLSVIEETNAYCWVDIVVDNADAWVWFEGDSPSNLADPSFAAKAGEINHVVILIGKTYKVTCDMPFRVVAKSDPAIDELWDYNNALWLNWPVSIWAEDDDAGGPRLLLFGAGGGSGGGNSFTMHVTPSGLGGEFSWTNDSCSVSGSGTRFSYSCGDFCLCEGCAASGYYGYEGYRVGCSGCSCGCSGFGDADWEGEDDPEDPESAPGISVWFEDDAVIFEDAYENMPGQVVPRSSTVTKLHLVAHGGMKGGTATFTFANRGKLEGPDIPSSVSVPAGHCKSYVFTYRGMLPSGEDEDITVNGVLTESGPDGGTCSDEDKLTCVKLELEAEYIAPQNDSQNRHTYGVGELVKFKVTPVVSGEILRVIKADAGDNVTTYDTFGGSFEIAPAAENVYRCPAAGTSPDVTLQYKGVEYRPAMTVVEPQLVVTREATGSGTFWPGDVGMGILTTRNYIGPFNVSFSGVQIYEVPCANAIPPTGYFATTNYTGPLTHDYPNAGWLHIPDAQNYWTTDEAGRDVPYSNWSAGTLTWKVPIGWRRIRLGDETLYATRQIDYAIYDDKESRPLLVGGREDANIQTFEIETDGTSSIRKFGYKLERNRWLPFGVVTQTGED